MLSPTQIQAQGSGGAAGAPAYLAALFDIVDRIGEGTYGVVYLARSRAQFPRTLAVKTFKPGREGEGVSPTAIREMMLLRELRHEHIVRLDSVHLSRQVLPGLKLAHAPARVLPCMRRGGKSANHQACAAKACGRVIPVPC